MRRLPLIRLFERQMSTLKKAKCPPAIINKLRNQCTYVLMIAEIEIIPNNHLAFIPVIPQVYLDIYGLMNLLKQKKHTGNTNLDPYKIINKDKCKKDPYFIYDVENGECMIDKSPAQAQKTIATGNRRYLTVDEAIALCLRTQVLKSHNIYCAGSRYKDEGVPVLCIQDNHPRLSWHYINDHGKNWGIPFCSW